MFQKLTNLIPAGLLSLIFRAVAGVLNQRSQFLKHALVKRLSKSPQITRNCLDAVLVEFGERRAKPASALNFVEFDGTLRQLLEMVGIDSPYRIRDVSRVSCRGSELCFSTADSN
jgi:hypothetical protein